MTTVRDYLWLWGHEAGAHNDAWGLPAQSHVTPGQASAAMGIPNVIMVRYGDAFDAQQSVADLRSARRVVWSIVGAGGHTDGSEVAFVREQAARRPNWTGVMMDDFFLEQPAEDGRFAVHSPEALAAIREQLVVAGRRLDLWVVLYDHQLHLPVDDHLAQCDVVSFWTWRAADLAQLDANMARLEAIAPGRRIALGCYMWDYGAGKPMPLGAFQAQVERGLDWLRAGRIEGMIFLASCICDLDLDTIAWTREWVARVGEAVLERT
jgi:hypothetical protein